MQCRPLAWRRVKMRMLASACSLPSASYDGIIPPFAHRETTRGAMRPMQLCQCLWPVYEYVSLTQNGKPKHADRVSVFIQMPLCTRFACYTRRSFEYGLHRLGCRCTLIVDERATLSVAAILACCNSLPPPLCKLCHAMSLETRMPRGRERA